jgi:hypothetical protein
MAFICLLLALVPIAGAGVEDWCVKGKQKAPSSATNQSKQGNNHAKQSSPSTNKGYSHE